MDKDIQKGTPSGRKSERNSPNGDKKDADRVLISLSPSPPRRLFALAVLVSLGGLLAYLGLATPGMALWIRLVLVLAGAIVLVLAEHLRRATLLCIELTESELRDSNGRVLARIPEIRTVSRGAFALKPSHGFTLTLNRRFQRVWVPGMWWRLGRRVGVGGVTSAGQAKAMSEILTVLMQRQNEAAGDANESGG